MHRNFDFVLFLGGGGDSYLRSDCLEGRVTKIFNFAVKIKGVVGRVAHAESSDPATPPQKKFGTCTYKDFI